MKPYLQTDRATLYHGRAEDVYQHITLGAVSMVWSDGPYAMNKADWDRMGVDGLADWYAPHVKAWSWLCAPSATVYLWGTAEGWARIDPVMRAAGWTFRVLVTWLKTNPPSQKGQEAVTCWPDFTEVCGVYQRCSMPAAVRALRGDRTYSEVARLVGCDSRLPALWEGWPDVHGSCLPTRAQWGKLGGAWREYSRHIVPFTAPDQFSNVWTAPMVPPADRLRTVDGETHPCQKPLLFADRAIRASTRIGDTILDPFAGTNRIALACRRLPLGGVAEIGDEGRRAIGIEMDWRWLDAIRPALVVDPTHTTSIRQPSLFGGRS